MEKKIVNINEKILIEISTKNLADFLEIENGTKIDELAQNFDPENFLEKMENPEIAEIVDQILDEIAAMENLKMDFQQMKQKLEIKIFFLLMILVMAGSGIYGNLEPGNLQILTENIANLKAILNANQNQIFEKIATEFNSIISEMEKKISLNIFIFCQIFLSAVFGIVFELKNSTNEIQQNLFDEKTEKLLVLFWKLSAELEKFKKGKCHSFEAVAKIFRQKIGEKILAAISTGKKVKF